MRSLVDWRTKDQLEIIETYFNSDSRSKYKIISPGLISNSFSWIGSFHVERSSEQKPISLMASSSFSALLPRRGHISLLLTIFLSFDDFSSQRNLLARDVSNTSNISKFKR